MITNMNSVNIINHPLTVPKFHGHMRLELRGCRETEIIEHDNNMTDALEMMLDCYGLWMNPGKVMNALCPTVQNAFGGILLADKALEEGSIAIPGGTEITACAAYNISNSDAALTQGSYNYVESVFDLPSKKMTYVYDWTTNQGNGTIESASLTNVNGGMCAYGDSGLTIGNSNSNNILFDSTSNKRCSSTGMRYCLINDDYEISASINNKKLTVYKTEGVSKSVLPIYIEESIVDRLSYEKYEKFEYDTTDLNNCLCTYTDGTNVYYLNSVIYPGNTFILYKLNTKEMILTEISMRNNTDKNLIPDRGFEVYDDKLYLPGNDYNIYEININNPTDTYKFITNLNVQVYLNRIINLHNGKIYVFANGKPFVIDVINKSVKATRNNCSNINTSYRVINQSYCPIIDISSFNYAYRYIPRIYLATINNLDKPITKTADKTMKVTYSIQEV